MSRDTDERSVSRRTVIEAVAAGGAALVGTGGAAAAIEYDSLDGIDTQDCDCHLEFRCNTALLCSGIIEPDTPYQQEIRECCVCDNGETACDDWSANGDACCAG